MYAINWLQPKNRSFHLSSKCAGFSKKYTGGTKNSYHMYLAVNIMKMVESSDAEWSSYTMIILHLGKGHVHDQSNVLCDMIKLLPIAVNPLYGNIECRPVGTNLKLVRRVRAKNLLSMKAEWAKRAERLTAWGPGARLRAPGGVQGQSPGGGPGGSAPGSSWVLAFAKCPERLSRKYFFFL